MKMTGPDRPDTDPLEPFFAAARAEPAPDDFLARIEAQGVAMQAAKAVRTPRRRRFAWLDALGGWPALGGMAVAGVSGLALGFWAPDVADPLFQLSGGYSYGDLVPGYALTALEEF